MRRVLSRQCVANLAGFRRSTSTKQLCSWVLCREGHADRASWSPRRLGLGPLLLLSAAAGSAAAGAGAVAADEHGYSTEECLDQKAVDRYIDDVLSDQDLYAEEGSLRIHLPVALRRHLFRTLIKVVLDMVHEQITNLKEPAPLLGHQLTAKITASPALLQHVSLAPADEQLEQIVDERFLPNSKVNIAMIPDSIERGFYISCLRVLKTVLIDVLATMRITIVGQTLSLQPAPVDLNRPVRRRSQGDRKYATSCIDEEALQAVVQAELLKDLGGAGILQQAEALLARPLYVQMFRLTLVFFEEFCATSELEFLGYHVDHYLAGAVSVEAE